MNIQSPYILKQPSHSSIITHSRQKPFSTTPLKTPPAYIYQIQQSLKDQQNKISSYLPNQQGSSNNNDLYLDKVMKANLDKMSRMRHQYQEQKDKMRVEIRLLRMENSRLNDMIAKVKASQVNSNEKCKKTDQIQRQKSNLIEKVYIKQPNPQKQQQTMLLLASLRFTITQLQQQNNLLSRENHFLSQQKSTLTNIINQQKLQQKPVDKQIINIIQQKKQIKQLQKQINEKERMIVVKDEVIDQLNQKILCNGLLAINTKYKYIHRG